MCALRVTAALVAAMVLSSTAALATPPEYTIVDMGVVDPGDIGSQAFRISPGGIATGRSLGTANRAFSWTELGGLVGLPNLTSPARPYSVGNGVNDAGIVVGTGATTFFGSDPLPLIWQNGVVSQLPLPAGQAFGRANDINMSNVAVGSVGAGLSEVGVFYAGGSATIITQTTPGGSFLRTGFGINDADLIVGFGIDPHNAARNVPFVYDRTANTAFEVDPLPGMNGGIAFDVSEAGHIVGTSMLNQGAGMPFIWTEEGGTVGIPLPLGTSLGSARGVNSAGWAVGIASSAYAIPFLYDGSATYALADLLPPDTDWDLSTNTSSSAMGISEDGIIVGTGVLNGDVRAFAMIPIPEPATALLLAPALLAVMRRRG
jgi:uncharacterized membrane protein